MSELSDCHVEIRRLTAANLRWQEQAKEQNQRIKRLEEVGDEMARWLNSPRNLGGDSYLVQKWRKSKEAKP